MVVCNAQTILVLLCNLSSWTLVLSSSPRTRKSFDFDWKFNLGYANEPSCNASSFPEELPDAQCLGLVSVKSSSYSSCLEAACATGSPLWQYNAQVGCWVGNNCDTTGPGTGWKGARRPKNATCGQNAPCAVDFDDSTWRQLNVPHDFVVEGTFDPTLDPNHAALATNVSWYRKEFTIDTSMEGQLIWLTFDGVFRAADVYVNGVLVKHHDEGYTSFQVQKLARMCDFPTGYIGVDISFSRDYCRVNV